MSSHALNLRRPTSPPRNNSGVIAAKTNWKYAKVAVGKWKGMRMLAPETAWSCSCWALKSVNHLPTKLDQNDPDAPKCACGEPKASESPQPIPPTSVSENPAKHMNMVLTIHFFCTSPP